MNRSLEKAVSFFASLHCMKSVERVLMFYAWLSGFILMGAVGTILGYLFYMGFSSLKLSLIFGTVSPLDALLFRRPVFNGLFPAIAGTLGLVLLSVGMAVPVGTAAGIYMAEYADDRVRRLFTLIFDILAGIPSIVIGLFGFSVTIFLHHHFLEELYPCLLISAFSLAFLVLPYLIRSTQAALESIPDHVRMTGIALGASRIQNIIYVLIPHSLPGIISGVVLAIGRCAEDTAVIMLTGVVATAGVPRSLLDGYEALPFYIYYISSQYTDSRELMSGFSAAILLILICLLLFLLAYLIKYGLSRYMLYTDRL